MWRLRQVPRFIQYPVLSNLKTGYQPRRRRAWSRAGQGIYLNLEHLEENPLRQMHGHSITYRIAVGPQQGRKVFTLRTLLPRGADDRFAQVAKAGGFSLHAGVSTQAHQRHKLERIRRYVARPPDQLPRQADHGG